MSSADELVGTITAREKRPEDHAIVFDCNVRSDGRELVSGSVTVVAPTSRVTYTDLATPYAGTNYTFAHLGPRSLMDQVTMAYYDAGHMFYTHEPSRKKFRDDLVKFMTTPVAAAKIAWSASYSQTWRICMFDASMAYSTARLYCGVAGTGAGGLTRRLPLSNTSK